MADPIPLRISSLHDGAATWLRVMIFDGDQAPGVRAARAMHDHLLAQRVARQKLLQPANRGRHAR